MMHLISICEPPGHILTVHWMVLSSFMALKKVDVFLTPFVADDEKFFYSCWWVQMEQIQSFFSSLNKYGVDISRITNCYNNIQMIHNLICMKLARCEIICSSCVFFLYIFYLYLIHSLKMKRTWIMICTALCFELPWYF